MPKTHAHGAVRWVSAEKAIVQLSLRGKWADIFWFSLFHEIGHILLHGRRDIFIEWEERAADSREREADEFAGNVLIPRDAFRRFVETHSLVSRADVVAFTRSQGVSSGIVVGRLQHEGILRYSDLNGLRMKLDWAEE